MKPVDRSAVVRLEDLPNVGRAMAADLRLIGIDLPEQLIGRDPFQLYEDLCAASGQRHDPCVVDVFISAVRFMEGGEALPWWHHTAERKRRMSGYQDCDEPDGSSEGDAN